MKVQATALLTLCLNSSPPLNISLSFLNVLLSYQTLTLEEVKARQERLAKMRSVLFHHELKAKRLAAIKSKDYRKRMAKVRAGPIM